MIDVMSELTTSVVAIPSNDRRMRTGTVTTSNALRSQVFDDVSKYGFGQLITHSPL